MRVIKLTFNQQTGEILNLHHIPEDIQSKISAFYLNSKRNKSLSSTRRKEIARQAGKKSGQVRRKKARQNKKSQA